MEALPLPGPTEGEPSLAADTPSESALQVTGGGEANDSIGADADADDAIDWADEPVTSFVAVEAGHLDDAESDPEAHAGSSAALSMRLLGMTMNRTVLLRVRSLAAWMTLPTSSSRAL